MAKHRIRRWLQFGVVDLLLLTTIVAAVVVLWRSPQTTTYYEPLAEGTTPGQHWAGNGLRMKFRWCPAGNFTMGSQRTEPGHDIGEGPVDVRISRGFWLGKYEVTQGEHRQVMSDNPSSFPDAFGSTASPRLDADYLPVGNVRWDDAVAFCRVLTEQERKAGRLPIGWEYRLPTEAQWEYACRAGTQTGYSFGDDESRLGQVAWYAANSQDGTHDVGQKLPNAWGLHDMHGNVWEWCSDWYQDKFLGGTDPKATEGSSYRVFRGGSRVNTAGICRSAVRGRNSPGIRVAYLGFRVALVQQAGPGEQSESK